MTNSHNHAPTIRSLTARADFLRMRRPEKLGGYYRSTRSFLLQAAPKKTATDETDIRLGLTVTKKMGNAVCRNRIKRRLRACAKALLPLYGQAGYDYVLIARHSAQDAPFAELLDDFKEALIWPSSTGNS